MAFHQRCLRTLPPLAVAGRHVKRYQLTVDQSDQIDPKVQQSADEFLPRLLPELDGETPPVAFVVLHKGSAVWINAYSWVWDNVIDSHAAEASIADPTHFGELARRWVGCVWELSTFAYERTAFVRHMLVPDKPDLQGYLDDMQPPGLVGLT